MLSKLPASAQLYARTALYSPNPETFCDFLKAPLPEPALPEPQFIKIQSYEETRLNWLGSCARQEIRQASINRAEYEVENDVVSDNLQTRLYRRDCAFVQRFYEAERQRAQMYLKKAMYQRSSVDICESLAEYCFKWELISNFPVSDDVLWDFTADTLRKIRNATKQELGTRSFAKGLIKSRAEPVSRDFTLLMAEFADIYDTIARKVQEVTFTLKTEKIDDKKKKEPEIVEEWVEDASNYCEPLETAETIDWLIDFAHFTEHLTLKELRPEAQAGEYEPVYYYEYASTGRPACVPCILAVISEDAMVFSESDYCELGDVTFVEYDASAVVKVAQAQSSYVVIHGIPADIGVLSSLDAALLELFWGVREQLPELHFTAFSRVIVRRFDLYDEFINANLGHVYFLPAFEESCDYDALTLSEISGANTEMRELRLIDDIIKARRAGEVLFRSPRRDLLQEWNVFNAFIADCVRHYEKRKPTLSFDACANCTIVHECAHVQPTLRDLLLEQENEAPIHYSRIATREDLGDSLMSNYCALHQITYNFAKLEFYRRKELELAEMDPKKRPAAKKAEKVIWQPQSFADSLSLQCGNGILLQFAQSFEEKRSCANESLSEFGVYLLIIQLLIQYQKNEDFAALSSDVDRQFAHQFETVIAELNSVLAYCCALNPSQRRHELLISDQLLTLHTVVQQSLEGFEHLYARTATEFKQAAENILEINKKIPQGVVHFCEEILALHVGDDVQNAPSTRESSAKAKAPASKAQFNFRDVKLSNFNQFISVYFAFVVKKLVRVICALQLQYVAAYQFLVYYTAIHGNLQVVYPTTAADLAKVSQKAVKTMEEEIREYSTDSDAAAAAAAEELVPADGIALDKYLQAVERLSERLPTAFPSQVYVPETGECVTIKLGQNSERLLSALRSENAAHVASQVERIKQLLADYTSGIVGVIKQTLCAEETEFANCEQAVGSIGELIQKGLEEQNFVQSIEIVGPYEVVMHRERLADVTNDTVDACAPDDVVAEDANADVTAGQAPQANAAGNPK